MLDFIMDLLIAVFCIAFSILIIIGTVFVVIFLIQKIIMMI